MISRQVLYGACAVGLAVAVTLQWPAKAASRLIPFQGRLTDAQGNVVADGARVVQFKIYDAPVGGTAVWKGEVQKLTVNDGLVSTLLGTKANLSNVNFDRELYLELTVDANNDDQITAADPPLLPRQSILPAVFAKEAADSRLLAGHDWTPLFGANDPTGTLLPVRIADGSVPSAKLVPASITADQVAPNTITAAQIADGTITAAQIAPGTITRERLEPSLTIDSIIPPGTIVAFGGSAIPAGWLLCDGRSLSRSEYPRLFAAIGTAWGSADSTVFYLPELRGLFLRGVSGGLGYDPDRDTRSASNPGGNTGNAVGSFQNDDFKSHSHDIVKSVAGTTGGTREYIKTHLPTSGRGIEPGFISDSGGSETRPKNAYVNYIIKM